MKKIYLFIILLFFPTLFFGQDKASASEIYIQVKEIIATNELQVDLLHGHIRDYVTEIDINDLKLYVLDPNEEIQSLPLEQVGVQARAYVPISIEGNYTFWAMYQPKPPYAEQEDNPPTTAITKQIYPVGTKADFSQQSLELPLEVIPTVSIESFTEGKFTGEVLFNETALNDTAIMAFGPNEEVLEVTTNEKGEFEFIFDSVGIWLLKTNIEAEDTDDEIESTFTSTFVIDTSLTQPPPEPAPNRTWIYVTIFLVGGAVGACGVILLLKHRGKQRVEKDKQS
ncbi:DUF4198 domain-containing protein [Halalkalibacter krulwichiae]|uniref:Nickel uptake substrate-specific transmembrane region n=1 Tax=Halalkalibacter krulwichiae TaxID=199441 RepID=A0A1X9MB44_9BACI|nr:DUF4198 domain-containing protein [Halalkalibacter krulwichiae]ARK30646.1 Nickel uptake substrate-specific transmembrane region [Halalkalibacter krulwichiae]